MRYKPWAAPHQLQDELKQVFDKLFTNDETDQSNIVTSQWTPRVDIKEESGRFLILADIPGVEPKAIEIHMEKGVLSIKGERTIENKEENNQFTRVERSRGSFYRRFALPDSADADRISATGKHGVLEITIPKKPETTPRRITIES